MAKTLHEAAVTTRNARAALPVGLHWRGIDRDVHLGYRKGKRGGVWLVRWRTGVGYTQAPIGTADDKLKVGTLDFEAASRAARTFVDSARQEAKAAADGPAMQVCGAVGNYISARDAREAKRAGRPVRSDASQRLSRYVLGQAPRGKQEQIAAAPLAGVALHALTERDLQTWRDGLPKTMKATTRQRLINDLKAALNGSYAENRGRLQPSLPAVIKHGLRAIERPDDEVEAVAREDQILADGEIGRLLRAAREVDAASELEGDFFRLVLVLAATGARLSQVVRMRVRDCQIGACRLMVPVSRKGRGGKGAAFITVPVGRDTIDALVPVVTGRPTDAFLLERWRSEQVKGSIRWQRTARGPWLSAAEMMRPWQDVRKGAGLPDVIPYALRHSSIVKGIRANLPIRLVAALHDTSTAMIERHYSKWITSGLEEMARAAILPLVPSDDGAVVVNFKSGA